jgi:Regulator of chromosome condensation (RCC1) repeat
MLSRRRDSIAPLTHRLAVLRLAGLFAVSVTALSCGGDVTPPPTEIRLSTIIIDGGSREIERGTSMTVTAVARDTAGKVAVVPLAWRSSLETVARFDRDGKLVALDTGVTVISCSALGVTSAPIAVHVAWRGAAKVASFQFQPPVAVMPAVELADSIRVLVTTLAGGPAAGATVAFAVTKGSGTVTPALDTVGPSGFASAKWTLGNAVGDNVVTATVVNADRERVTWVQDNPASFTVKSYIALTVVRGDAQTASVLSSLPVIPTVRLVDSAGKPRPGVPISFTATGNGRVANPVVSTSVDGVASPGVWTLGDKPGDEQLVAKVEDAKLTLHATATGTTVRFSGAQVATAQTATCIVTVDQLASCFGAAPNIGTGDTARAASPTLTKGGVHLTSITGGGSHFCGTSTDLSIYCWGINSLVDTAGVNTTSLAPTRLQSNTAWLQVTAGGQHNCALANDGSASCWGIATSGQLGHNDTTRHYVPAPVSGGFKFSSLAAGAAHECGITVQAALFCWGNNVSGQLGDGTQTNRLTPTAVSANLRWKSVGAGTNWTCALTEPGAAYCWGAGPDRTVPEPYLSAPTFASISVGAAHACALTGDGKAYCWGDNSSGQLGDSTTTRRNAPTEVATELRFTSISAGPQHTCAVTTDRFIACWGRNTVGELGIETALVQVTPRFVVIGVKP